MTNPPKSSSSSCIGNIAPSRTSLHKRSASDSLTFVNKSYSTGPGAIKSPINGGEGCLKLKGGDGDKKAIDHNFKEPEGSSSASSLIIKTHHQNEPRKGCQSFDPNMESKKIKRLLANRVSAQKSRLRKLEYIEQLKKAIDTELSEQAKVSLLAPQVAFYEHQRKILQNENIALKQRMEALEKENAKKQAETKALKDERDMVALTYFLQQGL